MHYSTLKTEHHPPIHAAVTVSLQRRSKEDTQWYEYEHHVSSLTAGSGVIHIDAAGHAVSEHKSNVYTFGRSTLQIINFQSNTQWFE